jgi:hypothetical protein
MSLLAMVIGVLCAYVALALLRLIGLFTNLFYFGRWNTEMVSPAGNHLRASDSISLYQRSEVIFPRDDF